MGLAEPFLLTWARFCTSSELLREGGKRRSSLTHAGRWVETLTSLVAASSNEGFLDISPGANAHGA